MSTGATSQAGGWRRGKEWRRSRRQAAPVTGTRRPGGPVMMAIEPDEISEAGGWRRGKEWRRSRRQAAPVTGPAGGAAQP